MSTKIPDNITLDELVRRAAHALTRAGMQHRIDIFRDVEVDDPAVRMMLGRRHRVRVRVKITAASLLFEASGDEAEVNGANGANGAEIAQVEISAAGVETRSGTPINGSAVETKANGRVNGSHEAVARPGRSTIRV